MAGHEPPRAPDEPQRPAPTLQRRFSDEEVADLIRRALALQERSTMDGGALTGASGLTLAEVQQVAAEVGIDPRFVELAASTGPREDERLASALAGAPYGWRFGQTVAGEVAEADRPRLVEAIRGVLGAKGDVEDVYGRMEWSRDDGLGPVIVGVTSRDGRTEVDVSARRGPAVGLLHGMTAGLGGVFVGGTVAGLLGLAGPVVLPVLGGAAGVSYLVSRQAWRLRSRIWEERLRRVTTRVSEAAAQVARLPPPARGVAPEAGAAEPES
jgi:hypothetical protein